METITKTLRQQLRCVAICLMGVSAFAQGLIAPYTIADITGTGSAVQVYSTGGPARTVQFVALSTNSAVVRCGDSNVSATRGIPIAAGGGYQYSAIQTQSGDLSQPFYDLGKFYCYIGSGDKVSVSWTK